MRSKIVILLSILALSSYLSAGSIDSLNPSSISDASFGSLNGSIGSVVSPIYASQYSVDQSLSTSGVLGGAIDSIFKSVDGVLNLFESSL